MPSSSRSSPCRSGAGSRMASSDSGYVTLNERPHGGHMKLLALVGSGKRVLDVGCSSGYLARPLIERGCTVVGIELDEKAAEAAGEVCAEVLVGDVETMELPFPGLVRRRPVRRSDRAPARARAVPGSHPSAAPRRRPARADDAERRELDDAPRAPRRSLALHRARHPRPHASAPLHASARSWRRSSGPGTGSSSSTTPSRYPVSAPSVERAAHAFGRLRPSLFAYQFVVAATPVR